MARVTTEFGISGEFPFVDVRLETDNRLFLDPSILRNHRADPLKKRAHDLVQNFFEEVLRCRFSSEQADLAKGEGLLRHLHEPNETRLGLSENEVRGHGFGDQLAKRLWDTLATNPACVESVLTRLEDVPLFIDRVGDDLISDLTTRVTFEVLADFTNQMMNLYPAFQQTVTTAVSPIWSPNSRTWVDTQISLPFIERHQLLLVPKNWIHWRLLMQSEQFYNQHSTRVVQEARTTYALNGRANAPLKREIVKDNPDRKRLNNEMAVKHRDDDLVGRYRRWVDAEHDPMSDAEIDHRLD